MRDARTMQPASAARQPFVQLDRVHDQIIEAAEIPGSSLPDVVAEGYWRAPSYPSARLSDLLCSAVQAAVLLALQLAMLSLAAFVWVRSGAGTVLRGKAARPKGNRAPLHVVSARPTVSVVIPGAYFPNAACVLNEAACIGLVLRSADIGVRQSDKHLVELLLVDSGCTDRTLEAARRVAASVDFGLKLRVVKACARGRGNALSAGAAAATGEIVLFVHADTLLPTDYHDHLSLNLAQANVAAVAFSLQVPRHTWAARRDRWALSVAEWGTQTRSQLFELPFGDQALAVTARRLERCGGVSTLPILEDVELIRRLSDRTMPWGGAVVTLPVSVLCSPRRWMQYGLIRVHLINVCALLGHIVFGVPAHWLYRVYYGKPV